MTIENTGESRDNGNTKVPVVGIGGSAGSLVAFNAFFRAMPDNSGMAFVVVAHLDPDHVSLLPELLQKCTKMPVCQVEEAMAVKPNHVYVIPPNKDLRLLSNTLQVLDLKKTQRIVLPIDNFFRSLALDQGSAAVGIVLSGMGSDGTQGLKEIKAKMGMAIVQDENTAEYGGMPRSAIATGLADFILAPEKIPVQLITYTKYLRSNKKLAISAPGQSPLTEKENTALRKILIVLRTEANYDFSQYKTSTVYRRIERRMNLHHIDNIENYVRYLQESKREVDALFNELLIGVTNFFRDAEAFDVLQDKILNYLLESKPEGYSLRAWVPGCSTGEEAYSIAIILHECMDKINRRFNVQLFATDIDKNAIVAARTGIYSSSVVSEVDSVRLKRYFDLLEGGQYQIKKFIREVVLFAPQNITSDPPFTKLDLISCRNLLIYLKKDIQRKLIPLFQYSLKPGGILFLGSSETPGHDTDMFSILDSKWKIFQKKTGAVTSRPILELPLPMRRESIKPETGALLKSKDDLPVTQLIETILRESNAPPTVIIDDACNAVYIHGRTGKFLEPAEGKPSVNILEMARPGLKAELNKAIRQVGECQKEIIRQDLTIAQVNELVCFDLMVKPVWEPRLKQRLMMVAFKEKNIPLNKITTLTDKHDRTVADLAQELANTKQSLQTTIEELEIANEEFRSANEELQLTNEELQSSNEELETSKEELQSLNEESVTVNAEMQSRIEELSKAHDDMKNLLDSTDIATIFLDMELRIRWFTPKATEIIPLAGIDSGRPVKHFATNLVNVDLTELAQHVLEDLAIRTVEVDSKDNQHYLLRVRPYRTINNVIDGVVMTFEDITDLKQAKDSLRESEQRLSMAFRATNDMIWDYDFAGGKVWCNTGYAKLFGNRP
ncbi:MAG: chemotaxis protein CheB, partial [Gammaproteobacteria bacterium]